MIAVDTNILVYAHRRDCVWHDQSKRRLKELAESDAPWAIPWPSVHEFLAVVTHPKIYRPPTPLREALQQIEFWMESPSLQMIGETTGYWPEFKGVAQAGKVGGPLFHDARIIAICHQHGVKVLWTADRDFSRFSGVRTVNPALPAK